jgi:hypothetical protein
MSDVTFHTAWRRNDPDLVRDAKAFWQRIGLAITPEDLEKRASELCALAYADGQVAAVSTSEPTLFQRLRTRLAYYRTVVAPEFRRQHIASRLGLYSYRELAKWSLEHPEEKLMGLLLIFQSHDYKSTRNLPNVSYLGMQVNIVGYTPEGDHIRVLWFDHATLE